MEIKPHNPYEYAEYLSWKWNVYLHNEMDLPDAPTIHPSFQYFTVWTLLHNQTNQTNSANLAIYAAFLVVKIISSDHFLLLTIISSHSMSIKSKKLEFFQKFQKFAL